MSKARWKRKRRRRDKKYWEAKQKVKAMLKENPDLTVDEIQRQFPELPLATIKGLMGYLQSPISKVIEGQNEPTQEKISQATQPTKKDEIPNPAEESPAENQPLNLPSIPSMPTKTSKPSLYIGEGGLPPQQRNPWSNRNNN